MKNTLEGINRRLGDEEEWINSLEGRVMESNEAESQKEKIIKMKIKLKRIFKNHKPKNILI